MGDEEEFAVNRGVGGEGLAVSLERLWTPFRMKYVVSNVGGPDGCPFCEIPKMGDTDGLVVARGKTAFAVLNLYPYNPGHLMVVPYRHVSEIEDLDDEELAEIGQMTRDAVRAIKAVSRPHAFNTGLNLGAAAGGSLAMHLHQHVVPRWGGDSNFITVTANAKVMPILLSDTRQLIADAWPGE